jgi:phosphomannomutase
VDEQANTVGCDHLTAWLATNFLKKAKGAAVVYDLRSSKSLAEMIKEAGGKPVKSRVGHVFMKQAMAEHNAIFGGELSGHFYFRKNFYADSGAIAFAAVVSGLAAAKQPMSELIEPARRYVQSGEINFEVENKQDAIEELKEAFPKAKIETIDGVTLDMGKWWLNVRPSNTEPLLRLNLEGPDRKTVDAMVKDVSQYLGKRVAH